MAHRPCAVTAQSYVHMYSYTVQAYTHLGHPSQASVSHSIAICTKPIITYRPLVSLTSSSSSFRILIRWARATSSRSSAPSLFNRLHPSPHFGYASASLSQPSVLPGQSGPYLHEHHKINRIKTIKVSGLQNACIPAPLAGRRALIIGRRIIIS